MKHLQTYKNYKINESKNDYPTLKEVENASYREICGWYRFLPSPSNKEEEEILNLICQKFKDGDGFTSDLSKSIGWQK